MGKSLLIISMLFLIIASNVQAGIHHLENNFTLAYASENKSKLISSQQAARLVKRQYGGKILKVQSVGSASKPYYRVKVLKDSGHIISVKVDANSGRIVRK